MQFTDPEDDPAEPPDPSRSEEGDSDGNLNDSRGHQTPEPEVDVDWSEDPLPVSEAVETLAKSHHDTSRVARENHDRIDGIREENQELREEVTELRDELRQARERNGELAETIQEMCFYIDALATDSDLPITGVCEQCGGELEINHRPRSGPWIECSECETKPEIPDSVDPSEGTG